MQLKLYTDLGVEVQEGQFTYHVAEVTHEDGVLPQVHLFLTVNRFYSDIMSMSCDIGVFESLELLCISGGTKDSQILYELTTSAFSLNPANIQTLITSLKEEEEEK